jgi:hypothetical protein
MAAAFSLASVVIKMGKNVFYKGEKFNSQIYGNEPVKWV